MTLKAPIGILGGSFDPVHHGHLRLAVEAQQQLQLDHVRMIPLRKPAHREHPGATAEHRLRMLQDAVAKTPNIIVDDYELKKTDVSYTVNTLQHLNAEFPEHPLYWIMGIDSFATLNRWKDWQELFHYCHFLVAGRPLSQELKMDVELESVVAERFTEELSELHQTQAGKIMVLPFPVLNISSTAIREMIADGQRIDYLLPHTLIDYIYQNKLYQTHAN